MQCLICANLAPSTLAVVKAGQLATIFVEEYDLYISAQAGSCAECKLLVDALSLKRNEWCKGKEDSLSIVVNVAVGKPVQINWSKVGIFLNIFKLADDAESGIDASLPKTIGTSRLVPDFSGSEECLSTLHSWFSDCKSSHALCQRKGLTMMPTRLIDVGLCGSETADVHLVDTTKTLIKGEYMALSYCWGDPSIHAVVRTLSTNIQSFLEGISFKSLPLTLKHAIVLARRLVIRYVWVDALCIIQDDEGHWKREAARMCDVYSGAALTVVACRADGSSKGIFGYQKNSHSWKVPYKNSHVHISEDYGQDHVYNVLLHEQQELDPVHMRAWTLQEAVLSNRTVFFASQELRWECNSCRRCQCGKMSKQYPIKPNEEEAQYELYRTWRIYDFFPATTIREAYQHWGHMYVFYSDRVVSKDNDRLVAIGGLARRFAAIMKARFGRDEKYLAGLWLGSFPQDLLWHIEKPGLSLIANRRQGRPEAWRAPSWSWASMEAQVQRFFYGDMQSYVEILEAATELAGSDQFGELKEGPGNYLRVTGPMLRDVIFKYNSNDDGGVQRKFPTVTYRSHDLRQALLMVDNEQGKVTDEILQDPHQGFAFLIIGYSPGSDVHETLILRPVTDRPETFERFAMVRLGPHFREAKENRRVIDEAARYTIALV